MTKEQKRAIAIIMALVLVIGSIGGYMYYKRTPTYTFKLIQTAVEKHDWDSFSRHVDTENVLSSAYDVLVDSAMDDNNMDDSERGFVSGFIKMLKPSIVSAMNDEVKRWVKTGNTGSDENAKKSKEEQNSQQAADNLKKQTNINNSKFKGVAYTKKDGNLATVGITIEDKQLGKDFTLDLKMRQLDDGTWQILEISNLKEYIKESEKARREKLDELNKPVQEDIDKQVSVKTIKAQIVNADPWGFSKRLKLTAAAVFNSDKAISKIAGDCYMKDTDGKEMKIPYELNVNATHGNKNLTVGKELNPFIPSESKLMKANLSKYSFTMQISKITYTDGSTLELKKDLPD